MEKKQYKTIISIKINKRVEHCACSFTILQWKIIFAGIYKV